MRLPPGFGVFVLCSSLLVAALALGLASCQGSSPEQETATPTHSPVGGAGIRYYSTPVPRASGTPYLPALDTAEDAAVAEALAAGATDQPFTGSIAGFRFSGASGPPVKYICEEADTHQEDSITNDWPFDIGYFPPGSREESIPMRLICPDGRTMYAIRTFSLGQGAFSVSYSASELVISGSSVPESRLAEISIHGKRGVAASGLTAKGFGGSFMVWPSQEGFLRVYGGHLPYEELVRVSESVACADCNTQPVTD